MNNPLQKLMEIVKKQAGDFYDGDYVDRASYDTVCKMLEKAIEQRDRFILQRDAGWNALTTSLRNSENQVLEKIARGME